MSRLSTQAGAMLTLVVLAAGGCQRGGRTGSVRAADDYALDNVWHGHAVYNSGQQLEVTAPQSSTTPQGIYQQVVTAVNKACAGGIDCIQRASYSVWLTPDNAQNPPPPALPFSQAFIPHYSEGHRALIQFLQSGALGADAVDQSLAQEIVGLDAFMVAQDNRIGGVKNSKKKILADASQRLKDQHTAIAGPLMSELANDMQNAQGLATALAAYRTGAAAINQPYAALVQTYQTYRSTENDTMAALLKVAQQASVADLSNFGSIQDQLLAIDANEAQLPGQLVVTAARLTRQLAAIQDAFDRDVAPYRDFMAQKGFAKPDVTTTPLHSLDAMRSYCTGRMDNVRRVIRNLIDGLSQRMTALTLQAADAASQPARAAAMQLAASTNFVNEINQRTAHLWDDPPTSTTLQLPFVAAQLDTVNTFLGIEPMCSGTSVPAYMQTGCKLVQPQLSRAHRYVATGLASTIRLDIYFMQQAGVDASLIQAISDDLAAGNLTKAALDHDSALHVTDLAAAPADGGTDDDEDDQ